MFLIVLSMGYMFEIWTDNEDTDPHLFIIDPMYETVESLHMYAINKINDWFHTNTGTPANTKIIKHTMVNLTNDNDFNRRECGAVVCCYMWELYKHVVSDTMEVIGDIECRLQNH